MKFYLYHPVHFENWDYRNSITTGIGGSETHQVEIAWRLARRGHKVTSYAPIPKDCEKDWRGTRWEHLDDATFKEKGIWVIYRHPPSLENFKKRHPGQEVWFVAQDEWYPDWTPEHSKIVDKVIPLCSDQAERILKHSPELKDKIWQSSNGLKMELIREVETEKIKRNPNKLIYASSPDRGLKNLLKIFKRAREFEPKLELHIFYGFDNIDKLIKMDKKFKGFADSKEELQKLMKQPGVTWHGRVDQKELYRQWLSAAIWCYPTNFTETSCITCMEAQGLGAIPITRPLWALRENVMNGIFVHGDATDELVQARYVGEILRLSQTPALQEEIRTKMMADARSRFNWERQIDQLETWIYNFNKDERMSVCQFNYQLKKAKGKILNIGCDIDPANLKALGATNLDILEENPLGRKTKADIIADARELPTKLYKKFDTVVLGDILEHVNNTDMVKILSNAKNCLKRNGKIVITCPEDYRSHHGQHIKDDFKDYGEGISSYHERPVTLEILNINIELAGMKIKEHQAIDYTLFTGWGVVCS